MSEAESLDGTPSPKKRRNWWIWVSVALAIVAAGLLIWALTIQSDLDSTQQELAGVQEELDGTQQALGAAKQDVEQLQADAGEGIRTGVALGAGKLLYDEEAQKAEEQAEKEAEAAEQKVSDATDETEKAQAEAEQARAELEAAEARATVAADCAKAYISA